MTMFYSINSNNYITNTTKVLVKIGKKNLGKIELLENQKSELKFSGFRIRIPEILWFRYGSLFYRSEISSTRTETSFGSGTQIMNTPNSENSSLIRFYVVIIRSAWFLNILFTTHLRLVGYFLF